MRKIELWHFAEFVRQIVGGVLFARLQSFLKFILAFRKEYSYWGTRSKFTTQTYVFMIDGKTIHGGMSDRFRGAMSIYSYCKKYNKQFKICWTYPFNLQDYLQPASVKWIAERNDLSFNLRDVSVKFFNTYTGLDGKPEEYYSLLKSKKKEIHVYSNISIEEELYSDYFKELFVPVPRLQSQIDNCIEEIGRKYVSVTFRFIGLLGDFKDDTRWLKNESGMCPEEYIERCMECIDNLHAQYPNYRILVTADSPKFLKAAESISYVYVIPGNIVHMDFTDEGDYTLHLKPFVDFYMVSMAEKCFIYHIGEMFKYTRFAKTAALVGGKELETINEE